MGKYVITIARGYGSGGCAVATALSKKLGIPFYDEEILKMASDVSGISEEYFFQANEKINKGKISIMTSKGAYTGHLYDEKDKKYLSNENMFNYQAKVMRELAADKNESSCIIVGKAANYVLRSFPNVLRINLQAPLEYCVGHIVERTHKSEAESLKDIMDINRYRTDYYKYYTGRDWLDPKEYDLSINTSIFGEEQTAEIIASIVKENYMDV